jgi:hypothetical protein
MTWADAVLAWQAGRISVSAAASWLAVTRGPATINPG